MPGFTKFDNPLFEKVLTSGFTKRQIKVLLLIVRFSAGYQKSYAVLRKSDFAYAGVSPYCIAAELAKLVRMRVIRADDRLGMYWLNPDLAAWDVPCVDDVRRRFFKIAAKNSPRSQLRVCQPRKAGVATAATPYKERRTDRERTADEIFSGVLQEYLQSIAPLSEEETLTLREAVESYGPRNVQAAIRAASARDDRHFRHFLKTLDQLGTTARSGGLRSLRSGLQRYLSIRKRP